MKAPAVLSATIFAVLGLFVVGCSSPQSRIKKNQAAYDAAPPEIQSKIRAGQVDVGFTTDQVIMALGKPDRRDTRVTAGGESEVWLYRDHKPSFGFGLGVGGGSGSTSVGSGVSIGTGGGIDYKLGVVIKEGRVIAVERRAR